MNPPARLLVALAILIAAVFSTTSAQDSAAPRFYRLYLRDKGTPARTLMPGDPAYAAAAALLTPRALARRAKVLPADRLVTTDDLPVFEPYLDAITATGAHVEQTSRWLNTVMVTADSAAHERLAALGFLDSMRTVRARLRAADPAGKRQVIAIGTEPSPDDCIEAHYGRAGTQNRAVHLDAAHELGIAGEGVLVGVLDAGFDWRNHEVLRHLNVIGEYDFVDHDSSTADVEGADAEGHGTAVMSMIGGLNDDLIIGGAPHASFVLAKTEDVRSERNVEEDSFVAGLEWVEAQGADVTNTSLGYTEFDAPELRHEYSELNGHTAHASRGLNHAVGLGMICVVAAGNEGNKGYRYVSVPGEADSSICVAAVDSNGRIAAFSSRGLPGRATLKPDVAAMGVANWGADHGEPRRVLTGQGTSFASPMTTAVITLILSARPQLRPWEVRELLYRTSDHATNPDTAYGHGVINCERALGELSRTAPIVGAPRAALVGSQVIIAAGLRYDGGVPTTATATISDGPPTIYLQLDVRRIGDAAGVALNDQQPFHGVGQWQIPNVLESVTLSALDRLELTFRLRASESIIRRDTVSLSGNDYPRLTGIDAGSAFAYHSVLCKAPAPATTIAAEVVPNPVGRSSVIRFQLKDPGPVTLVIYNAIGQEVERLIDGVDYPAGVHTIFFAPTGFASGAYYYVVRCAGQTADGAMICIP